MFTDDIILDKTAPAITRATLGGKARAGRATTAKARKVSLAVTATDKLSGVARIQVTTIVGVPAVPRVCAAISVDEASRVWVRIGDRAGNLSAWRSAKARRPR